MPVPEFFITFADVFKSTYKGFLQAGLLTLEITAIAVVIGMSLGVIFALMNNSLTMRRIVFPQALRRAIPPLGNQFIITLKDSSLVYVIGVSELFGVANRVAASNFKQFETFLVVGLYYLILVLIFSTLLKWYENKLDVDK